MAAGEGMGLKQVTADPVLAIACHVAAHAVAGILLGIPFVGAEIGAGRAAGRGRLAVDSMPFSAAEDHMACAMGGGRLRRPAPSDAAPALHPRPLLPVRLLRGNLAAHVRLLRRRRMERREEDHAGLPPLQGACAGELGHRRQRGAGACGAGALAFDEILDAATRPEPACPPGCQPQGGGSTGAGTREDVRYDEYAPRKHWDTCLHGAAHAVVDTRDGHGV